jgi:hypothetical protein
MRTSTLLLALSVSGCASAQFQNDIYRDKEASFEVGPLGRGWTRGGMHGADLVFVHPEGGTILANATCKDVSDVPLDVLANQELFGVDGQQEERREMFTLDGRVALREELSGTLDGVRVRMDLVVLKKDDCTYDLSLIASADAFEAREADFWRFVRAFRALSPRSS